MSTIVGAECTEGALLAADTALVRDGRVASTSKRRVFDFDDCGAAAVGGDVDEFGRQLEAEVREHRLERDAAMTVERFARVSADVAAETGVEAIIAAHDDGVARIRTVDADGGVVDDPYAARGSGAAAALGQLEAADLDVDLDTASSTLRDVLSAVAERDVETGDEVQVWRLTNAPE